VQRQGQFAHAAGFFHQLGRKVEAAAAGGAGTGPHRQLGHAPATGFDGLADIAIGDSIADADVHAWRWAGSRLGCTAIAPRMRMIVN
jgi:hypothetical protein